MVIESIAMAKKIPWWQPLVEKDDWKIVKKALDANFVNEGPLTAEFEKKLAKMIGVKYATASTSCTAGLFLALRAAGVDHGDEVIAPDITFIASINAIHLTGAKPVLVDIDPETMNIDSSLIEKAITSKTKAIMPVHVTGRACDMDSIMAVAKKHDISVIEDAAEALDSKYKDRYLGTIGLAGCFSFSPNKTISTGQGGMIVTNDEEFYKKVKKLKDHGRPVRGTGGDDLHDTVGYNFRISDLQGGLGLAQLRHFKRRAARMRRNYELYAKHLTGVGDLRIFPTKKGELPQWTDIETDHRKELNAYLTSKNIDSRRFWFPIHKQKAYEASDANFPQSTRMSPRCLWLPSAFTMTDKDVLSVCKAVKEFYKTRQSR